MQLFGGGVRYLNEKDMANTSAGKNILLGSKEWSHNLQIWGATKITAQRYLDGKIASLTSTGQDNSLTLIDLPKNSQLAWSCYAKSPNGPAILHTELNGNGGKKDIQIGSNWTRISSSGASNETATLFFWNTTPNTEIDLCLPKIELGSIATQWCPAPEDYVMKSDSNLKNAYPNVNCDAVGSDFDLNSNFVGWRKNMDNLGIPKNAPSGVLGTTFYLQMGVNASDPDTVIEIAIGLANQPKEGNEKAHPHIWMRQKGWQQWTEWFKVC